jgi:hypothetical protein
MTRGHVSILIVGAFAAGFGAATWATPMRAQGNVTELKRVDLGKWCEGKEAVISLEEIAPQHQSKHFHPAYSFAWMIEGPRCVMSTGSRRRRSAKGT